MLARVKSFLGMLAHHWFLSLLVFLVVAVFLSPWLNKVYEAVRARVPFLPESKYGTM